MPNKRAGHLWNNSGSFLFLTSPFLLAWAFFWVVPLFTGVDLAMQESQQFSGSLPGTGYTHSPFSNFERAVKDPKFIHSLENTSLFVGGSILITLGLSFFLAISVYELNKKLQGICLFLFLIPSFALPGSLATLFYLFFHGKSGALNQFLVIPLGFDPINWMMDPSWILPCLVLQAVWRWTGVITLVLYCGIRAIPHWQFEVARIEGASAWTKVRTILFPGTRHLLLFSGIFLLVDGVAAFSGAYNLLGGSGGVLDAGLLFVTYAYQVAFPGGSGRFDLPLASAACVLVAGTTACFAWLLLRVRKRMEN